MSKSKGRSLLSACLLVAALSGSCSAGAGAVAIRLHPLTAPGYEAAIGLAGSADELVLNSEISRSLVLQRISPSPFGLGPGLPVQALSIGAGPDGRVWAAAGGAGGFTLGELTPGGFAARYQFPSTPQQFPSSIASGPDGSVWVVNQTGEAVERLLPGGEARTYRGAEGGTPTSVAVSADGTAWVTETSAHEHLWEITAAGQVSEREIPSGRGQWGNCYCDAQSITVGPDGALWFAERLFGRLDRMTESGEFSQFAVPNPQNVPVGMLGAPQPESLIAGPGGALWFSDPGDDKIGRVTVGGVVSISEFPLPPARKGGEFKPGPITAFGGEVWGIAPETVTEDGVVKSHVSEIFSLDPARSEAPRPPAAAIRGTSRSADVAGCGERSRRVRSRMPAPRARKGVHRCRQRGKRGP